MVSLWRRRFTNPGLLFAGLALALGATPASAEGGPRLAYAAECSEFEVSLTALNTADGTGFTTSDREACTYTEVKRNFTVGAPQTRWLKFFSAAVTSQEIADLCAGGELILTSAIDVAKNATDPGDFDQSGGARFRVANGSLSVSFFWEDSSGARVVGGGVLVGDGCGVGESWIGEFSVVDPNPAPVVDLAPSLTDL